MCIIHGLQSILMWINLSCLCSFYYVYFLLFLNHLWTHEMNIKCFFMFSFSTFFLVNLCIVENYCISLILLVFFLCVVINVWCFFQCVYWVSHLCFVENQENVCRFPSKRTSYLKMQLLTSQLVYVEHCMNL